MYNTRIRRLKNEDPANAEAVFNPLVQQIVENLHAVKQKADAAPEARPDGKFNADLLEGHGADYFQVAGTGTALFGPVTVEVPASGWTGSGPWVQTVAVSGVTAEDTGLGVYPVDISDAAARKLYEKAYGCLAPEAETGTDSVTLTCRDSKPATNFQVIVKGVR